VVGLGFIAMLASSPGQSYWLALFVDDMIAGTGLGRTAFSAVYALATICSALMVLAIGSLFDRRGPGVTWLVVAVGLAAGGLVMSLATGALVAIVGLALLRAFGQGSFPLVGTLMVARTFEAWRGRALSVAHLGHTLAAAVLPAVAAVLLVALGWRGALQVTSLAVLAAIAPLALLVGWATGIRRPGASRSGGRRAAHVRWLSAARLRARGFPWRDGGGLLLVALAVAPLVTTAVVFHATSLLRSSGLGVAGAAAALSVLAIGGAAGVLVGGALVDRAGVRMSVLVMNLLLAVGTVLLLVPGAFCAYAAFVVLGVAGGVNGTGSGAAWAARYGVARLGELQGVGDAARIAAAALGPLPLAISLTLTGSFAPGLSLLVVLALACALIGAGEAGRGDAIAADPAPRAA